MWPFERLFRAGSFDVFVRNAGEPALEITGDDNLLRYVRTNVDNGTLRIDATRNLRPHTSIRIHVSTPKLVAVAVSGSSRVGIQRSDAEKFELDLSGSGVVVAEIHARELDAAVSGSGSARLDGEAERVDASVSGSGDLDLSEVRARVGRVGVSGSGDAVVHASDRLDTSVSGSGSIRYLGQPRVTKKISGSGTVRSR